MTLLNRIKVFFRPIYVPLIDKKNEIVAKLNFLKYIGGNEGHRAFVIGSPIYTNLGDSAILLSQIQFLQSCGYAADQIKEITSADFGNYKELLIKKVKDSETIYGLGGGNMGDQWPAEEKIRESIIHSFPHNNIVIFPQTIHIVGKTEEYIKSSKEIYNKHDALVLVARETKSYQIMRSIYSGATILLNPDIVLTTSMDDFDTVSSSRSGVLFVTRSDPEKSVNDSVWDTLINDAEKNGLSIRRSDMYSEIPVTKENRAECVRKKMQEFCEAELVITDRLHGMVFAALTGTPCIVFSNYNHKVKGTYDWISYLPYIRYVETAEEAEKQIAELYNMKNCHYNNEALKPYFDELAKVVKERCL